MVKEKTSFITTVPGGVVQSVVELGKNTYKAYCFKGGK